MYVDTLIQYCCQKHIAASAYAFLQTTDSNARRGTLPARTVTDADNVASRIKACKESLLLMQPRIVQSWCIFLRMHAVNQFECRVARN